MTPASFAKAMAASGGISLRLFSPSVSKTMTFDLASESRRSAADFASAAPMAVPSSASNFTIATSSRKPRRAPASRVNGQRSSGKPAKLSRATLSLAPTASVMRRSAKSPTTSLTTSSRVRPRSRSMISIELERSTASTMSTPSEVTDCSTSNSTGRASARTTRLSPATWARSGSMSRRWRQDLVADEICTGARRIGRALRRRPYQSTANTTGSAIRKIGSASARLPKSSRRTGADELSSTREITTTSGSGRSALARRAPRVPTRSRARRRT